LFASNIKREDFFFFQKYIIIVMDTLFEWNPLLLDMMKREGEKSYYFNKGRETFERLRVPYEKLYIHRRRPGDGIFFLQLHKEKKKNLHH